MLTLPLWLVFAKSLDLYARDDARADHSTADEAIGVISLVTVGTWIVFVSAWATQTFRTPRSRRWSLSGRSHSRSCSPGA